MLHVAAVGVEGGGVAVRQQPPPALAPQAQQRGVGEVRGAAAVRTGIGRLWAGRQGMAGQANRLWPALGTHGEQESNSLLPQLAGTTHWQLQQ